MRLRAEEAVHFNRCRPLETVLCNADAALQEDGGGGSYRCRYRWPGEMKHGERPAGMQYAGETASHTETMKLQKTLISMLALAAIPATAAVQQGLWEIGFSGSYQNNDVDIDIGDVNISGDGDTFSLTGSAGYFMTDALELTGFATYLQQDFGRGNTDSLLIGAAVDWHFLTQSNFVPYIGAGAAYGNIDVGNLGDEVDSVSRDDFVFQLRGGAKQFVAQNIAIRYQVEWNKGENLESLGLSLGLSTFF